MALIYVKDPRIERDIGDRSGRVPHYVVDRDRWEAGGTRGVLYWPDTKAPPIKPSEVRLSWIARAFDSPDEAAAFVEALVIQGCL